MPTLLTDFQANIRNMRCRMFVNLGSGLVDYTDYLDHYTVIQTLDGDNITGIYETVLDAELYLANPSINWSKPGLAVEAYIQISSDNWATQSEQSLFKGTTERQNSVPLARVKIRASSYNSNYLDNKTTRQVFIDIDAHTIIDTLLTQAGVPVGNKSISPSGVIIPVYYISNNNKVREYVEDILAGLLEVGGFDVDKVFRIRSISPLVFGTNGTTPDVTLSLDTILDYKQQDISGKYYCNTLTVSGVQKKYLGYDLFSQPAQIFFNNIIQNVEIKANSKLYYLVDMPNIEPETFKPFARLGEIYAPSTRSRYGFYSVDDASGVLDTSAVSLVSSSVAYDDSKKKDTFLLIFTNSSGQSWYLKFLNIIGTAVQTTGQIIEQRQDLSLLASDGKELKKELVSNAISDDVRASYVANILQLNYMQYADVYQFDARGRPEIKIGSKLQFQDRNVNNLFSVVTEYDTEVSIDKGFQTKITTKKLNTNLQFFGFDDSTLGLDDTNLQLL
jgi:hypothetical protein